MTQKHTSTKAFLLALLILAGMIVSPVCAGNYTATGYDDLLKLGLPDMQKDEFNGIYNVSLDLSQKDLAIQLVHFKVPQEHTVYFTLYYGSGNTASGSASNVWNVSIIPLHSTTSTITFNGETKEYSYVDTNPDWDYYLSGYGRDDDTGAGGLIVYHAGYGSLDDNLAIFKPISDLPVNLIYRVDLSCDAPFDADITYAGKKNVAQFVDKTPLETANEWIQLAGQFSGFAIGFVWGIFWILKFFFIDNLLLIIALWISVSMAYSAITSPNIWGFYKKFFRTQKALIDFIVSLWQTLWSIVNYLVQIFVKWL